MQTRRDVTTLLVNDLVASYEAKNAEHGNAYGDRIKKAGRLVLEGKVQKVEENHYLVQSGADPKIIYKVNGTCDCPDHPRSPAGWCKHRIAARFQHAVNLHFTKLTASGHHPHEHGYGCGNHNPPPIECWQVECPDGALIACPICEKNQPSPLSSVNTATGEITETPFPDEETDMMTTIGETLKKVITFSPLTGETPEPEPCGEKHPGMTCQEYERGQLSTEQYEPAPSMPPKVVPLPEAPVSMCLTIKLPENHTITYTMRGHDDTAVLNRLPNVLATLEHVLKSEVDHNANFFQRLAYAFFPKKVYSSK